MKRREFILGATSSAGILLLDGAKAATPCSPILIGGGPGSCSAVDAETDWQSRISGPGVVWYHDFRSDAEVSAFRAINSDPDPNDSGPLPGTCIRQTSDGVTGGGCLEIRRPAGRGEPPGWWRPFSPLDTGSGKAVNDPGASGTIPVKPWNSSNNSIIRSHVNGWYGHPDLQDANFDGHVFYLQVRVKADPRRITGGNEQFTAGKFCWFTTAEGGQSLSNAEHVFWSYGNGGNDGSKNYLRCYALGATGIGPFDPLDQEQVPYDGIQPGSDSAVDWAYSGGWDTLLFRLQLGKIGVTSGADATHLIVFAANAGQTEYTKIWDQQYGVNAFEARGGLQAFLASSYNNGRDMPQEFWQRFDQFIFSHDFIPCPQV